MNFKYYINSYKKQNGSQAIRLKIDTSKNDSQYIDSKISVQRNQWDPAKQLVKRHPLEEQMNSRLNALLNDIKKLHYKNPGASAKRLLQIYKGVSKYGSTSFLDYYQTIIEEMNSRGKTRSGTTNQKYLNKLKSFSSHIAFSDMSPIWAKEYEAYLLSRGNAINTVASNFKSITAVLNKAVRIGLIEKNPIKGYTITTENTEKESLTFSEIETLSDIELEPRFKGMIKSRDLFLFSFYTAGMRFTDMCSLKWEHIVGNDIVYTMNKSRHRSGSRRTIPLVPKALEILNRYRGKDDIYVFPPLYGCHKMKNVDKEYRIFIANNTLNRSIKTLAKRAKINKKMNIHMAKHSFANFAVEKDIGLLMISKLLGHTKLSTTQNYLKDFYQKEESAAMMEMFR